MQLAQSTGDPIAGETLIYRVNVYNGGAVKSAFTLTDTVPAGTEYDPSLSDPACYESLTPGVVVCQFAALGSGQQRQVDIAVDVPSDATAGATLTNDATASSDAGDSNPADNDSSHGVTVGARADLRLTKDGSHTSVSAGDTVTYTLTVKNLGPSLAQTVILSDTQPAGMVLQSATASQGSCNVAGGTATCDLGNLALRATATAQIIMTAGSGTVSNQATASAATADDDTSNNTATAELEIAAAARTTRTFGAVSITADVFVDLPSGGVQAFGDVWLGEHFHLAGETDSMVIDGGGASATGEGTVEYLQEGIVLFVGDFSGAFGANSATLTPAPDVEYYLDEMAGFPLANVTLTEVDLLSGRTTGSTNAFTLKAPGLSKTLDLDLFVEPGPVYGGIVGDFEFEVSGLTFEVTGAELHTEGVSASNVKLTLPAEWGGIEGSVSELVITEYGVSIGGAEMKVPMPDVNLSGEKVKLIDNSITIIYNGQDLMLIGDGTLVINLPDNEQQSQISFLIDSNGNFMAAVDHITLYLATLSLELTDVMVNNDGLYVAEAVLTLPPSLNESTLTVRDVSITEAGLEIGGGAVTVNLPDIALGSQVRFSDVALTLEFAGDDYTFSIEAVLQLRLPQNAQDIAIQAQIDNEGNFSGTVDQITLNMASATLTLTGIAFDNDGLRVDEGTLQLPPSMGGVSATLEDITIDENGLGFGGGLVNVPIPDVTIANFAFTGASLTIEFAMDRSYKFIIAGTLAIKFESINASATGKVIIDQNGNVKGEITGFSVGVAGMELLIEGAKIRDGVLSASVASLKVPNAWGGGQVTVYNIRISPDGIKIGGGKFALPEIKAGGISLGSLWGELREEGDGYIIIAGGKFNAGFGGPGCMLFVEVTTYYDSNGAAALKFKSIAPPPLPETDTLINQRPKPLAAPDHEFSPQAVQGLSLREVSVGIEGCRIRLLDPPNFTGFYLVAVKGTVTFQEPGEMPTLQIDVTIDNAVSPGSTPSVTMDAGMGMEFNPWKMDFWGTVTLFAFFEGARMDGQVRSGYFNLSIEIAGGANAEITAWSDSGFHMIGKFGWTVSVPKGVIFTGCINLLLGEVCLTIPPFDISLDVGVEFGEFKADNGTVWGLKGWVEVMGYGAGFYIDTDKTLTVGNVDQYQLVDPPDVARARALHRAMRADPRRRAVLSAADLQLIHYPTSVQITFPKATS